MPNAERVSIQQQTKGAVNEFLEQENSASLPGIKLLCFLCGALTRYEEEGVPLDPKVIFCPSIKGFVRSVPGGQFVKIGETKFDDRTGKKVLKECAPVARQGWHIYVQSDEDQIEYGVFSLRENPVSLPLRDILELENASLGQGARRSILVERVHAKEVVLRSSSGATLTVAFSTSQETPFDPAAVAAFAKKVTAKSNDQEYSEYYERMLSRILARCHGTIMICIDDPSKLAEIGLKDGNLLANPISIYPAYKELGASSSADAVMELVRLEALLEGFVNSDGLVALDTAGAIVGYRLFYREQTGADAAPEAANVPPIGGARRRAFEGVKTRLGEGISGVLFRSQDGAVEFEGAE